MRRIAPLFAIILLAACARGGTPAPDVPSTDEYAVWAAVVDSLSDDHQRLLVEGRTSIPFGLAGDAASLRETSGLSAELVNGYLARNHHPARVDVGRIGSGKVKLLPGSGRSPESSRPRSPTARRPSPASASTAAGRAPWSASPSPAARCAAGVRRWCWSAARTDAGVSRLR